MKIRLRTVENRQETSVWKNRIKWLSGAIWLLYCIIFHEKIREGFLLVCNLWRKYRGQKDGCIVLLYDVPDGGTYIWAVGAAVGLLILAVIYLSCVSRQWKYYAVKGAALVLGILICAGIWCLPLLHPVRNAVRNGLELAEEWVDDIRYGTNEDAGLCSGRIGQANGRQTSEDTMLKVAMSQPEGMYLRGFTGAQYEDGRWKGTDGDVLYEDMDLFYWLHYNGWYGQTQLAQFSTRERTQQENVIQVVNVNADRRYIYYPYETAQCAWLDENKNGDENICSNDIMGCDSYTITALGRIRTSYPEVLEKDGMDETTQQLHYREWVYSRYMDVPQDFQKQFRSVLEKESGENIGICEAKQLVLQYLEKYMTYDENPGNAPEDADALLYYMTRAQSGYDVQYASIATLMMRYLGIPARYVEGWLIPDEMAQDAGEGEVMNLTGAQGHAWTEIYVDGVGFVPFEATMEYRDSIAQVQEPEWNADNDTDYDDDTVDNPEQEQDSDEGAAQEQMQESGGSLSLEMEEKENETKSSPGFIWVCIATVIVLSILIFMIIRKIRKKQHFTPQDRRGRCQMLFGRVMLLLTGKGLDWDVDTLQHNIDILEERYTQAYARRFGEMWKLHEVIRFGGKDVSEKEYERFRIFYDETKKIVRRRNRRRKESL